MDNDDLVNYWTNCSDEDYDTMLYLFEGNRYTYSLFFGHLSIEKLLKALYAASAADDNHVIKSHNLLLLAQKCGLELSDEQVEKLQIITQFNISARYDDYKRSFNAKCTKEYTQLQLANISEVREWLKGLLTKE